ncbi:MAG: hypothetical protein ACR2OJ_16915 [Hyphomicrobiales bacterium]
MSLSLCLCLALIVPEQANAGNIYDSNVVSRLKLKGSQRTQAKAIVRKSDKEMNKVFRKHKINPRAKPDFDKLHAASSELQAIESREKAAMKKILSPEQYKAYRAILNDTAARVRAAMN